MAFGCCPHEGASSRPHWCEGWNTRPICRMPDCFRKTNDARPVRRERSDRHPRRRAGLPPARPGMVGSEPLRRVGHVSTDRKRLCRIVSQSRYKNRITTTFAIDLLVQQVLEPDHASWPHDVSLSDHTLFDSNCILGPNQITDV